MGNSSSQLVDGTPQHPHTQVKVEDTAGSPTGSEEIVVDKPRSKAVSEMAPIKGSQGTGKKRKRSEEEMEDGAKEKKRVVRGRPRDPSLLLKKANDMIELPDADTVESPGERAPLVEDVPHAPTPDSLLVKKKDKKKGKKQKKLPSTLVDDIPKKARKENLAPDLVDQGHAASEAELPKSSPMQAKEANPTPDPIPGTAQSAAQDATNGTPDALRKARKHNAKATTHAQSAELRRTKKKSKKRAPLLQDTQSPAPELENVVSHDGVWDVPIDDDASQGHSRRMSRNNPHFSDDDQEYVPEQVAQSQQTSDVEDAVESAHRRPNERQVGAIGKPDPRKRRKKSGATPATSADTTERQEVVSEAQRRLQEVVDPSPRKHEMPTATHTVAAMQAIPDSQPQAEPSAPPPLDPTPNSVDEVFAPILRTLESAKSLTKSEFPDDGARFDAQKEVLMAIGDRISSCFASDDKEALSLSNEAWAVVADKYWPLGRQPRNASTGQKLKSKYAQTKHAAEKYAATVKARADAGKVPRIFTSHRSSTELAKEDPTAFWDPKKKPQFAFLAVKYLKGLPENEGKRLTKKNVLEAVEKSAYFTEICSSLRANKGLTFEDEGLAKYIKRALGTMQGVQEKGNHVNEWLRGTAFAGAGPSGPSPERTMHDNSDVSMEDVSGNEYAPGDGGEAPNDADRAPDDEDPGSDDVYQVPEDADSAPDNTLNSLGARSEAPQAAGHLRISRMSRAPLPAPLTDGPSKGGFTDEEKAVADNVFDHICQQHNLAAQTLRCDITDWPRLVPDFKTTLAEALPRRTKTALRKFCRRRYVAKTEGPWTAAEDAKLLRAYQENPDKWRAIAELVDERTDQQCRDRWTNVVQYKGKLALGAWSKQEEERLVRAVWECMETIKEGKLNGSGSDDDGSDEDVPEGGENMEPEELEKLVAWSIVSEKMDTTRSRRRCHEKWQNLKRRHNGNMPPRPAAPSTKTTEDQAPEDEEAADTTLTFKVDIESKKQRAIARKYDTFATGDVYDVLVEIHAAIDDHSKVFNEESTLWSIIATKNKGSKFSSLLRRRAFQDAIDKYGHRASVMREKTVAGKAKAMVESLDAYSKKRGIEFRRDYNPTLRVRKQQGGVVALKTSRTTSVADPSRAAVAKKRALTKERAAPKPKTSTKNHKKYKSAERVDDSDVDDDDQGFAQDGFADGSDDYDGPAKIETNAKAKEYESDEEIEDRSQDVGYDYEQPRHEPDGGSEASSPDDEPLIPETQQEAEAYVNVEGMDDAMDAAESVSSLDSRYRRRVSRPSLGREEFMERCQDVRRRRR